MVWVHEKRIFLVIQSCVMVFYLHTVEVAVRKLNEVLSNEDPTQTLKALKNPDGNFPFIYQEASKYHKALLKEKKAGLPATILVSTCTCIYMGF